MSLDLEPINELHRKIQSKLSSMIHAKELRVGNLVNAITSLERAPTGIVTISEICHDGIETDKYMEYAPDYPFGYSLYPFEGLGPIPLTPEILEKCGFVKKQDDDRCLIFEWKYRLDEVTGPVIPICVHLSADDRFCLTDWGHTMILSERFQYLHQLQNLFFALSGDELAIKL